MHDTNLLEDQPIAWTPTPEVIERAQITRFMRQVGVSTWDELYEFSIRDVERFTEEVLQAGLLPEGVTRTALQLRLARRVPMYGREVIATFDSVLSFQYPGRRCW